MKSSVKKSINILQKLYLNGLIPYPRVSNDFEIAPFFEIFPHPPLPIMSSINEPLKIKEMKINKKTSLLTLSLLKLAKPSTLERISEKIDDYFDDELEFLDAKKKEELEMINALFLNFIEKQNLQADEIMKIANSFYSQENKDDTDKNLNLYKLNQINFFYKKKKIEKKQNKYLYAKKMKKESLVIENTNINNFNSLSDFIKHYKENKNKLMDKHNEPTINK